LPERGGDVVTDNPYEQQTRANTSTDWLDNQEPVDLNLQGMGEFATNMVTVKENLTSHVGYLDLLATLPMQAWEGGALPEGAYSMNQMLGNFAELQAYLAYLQIALSNIGMAAQTIADAYASTDGWSAASLDTVKWAYGDSSVPPPAGLPPWVTGKSYWDQYFESLQSGTQAAGSPTGATWTPDGQRVNADGSVTERAIGSDGRVREMTTVTIPGAGGTLVTTRVIGADGKELSVSSQRTTTTYDGGSVVTTTVSYDGQGNVTGSKESTTTYDDGEVRSTGTANFDRDGVPTTSTVTTTHDDGSQTVTDTSGDTVTREVRYGQQTDGVTGTGDTPAMDAIEEVQGN
jgi:hypothetical protein